MKNLFVIKYNLLLVNLRLVKHILHSIYKIIGNNFFILNILKYSLEKITKIRSYNEGVDFKIIYKSSLNAPKISILCPTRKRPENVFRLLESIKSTALNFESVEILFYVDEDDCLIQSLFATKEFNKFSKNITVISGKRILLSEMWNICYQKSESDILMQCGDDIVFKTNSWDDFVLNAFENINDKIVLVHGSDGINTSNFGTHVFLHRNWCEAVGYLIPPYFSSDYSDLWLNEIATCIGRKLYVPILTEHLHPANLKADYDMNYYENLRRGVRDNVKLLYDITKKERDIDMLKLKLKIIESALKN